MFDFFRPWKGLKLPLFLLLGVLLFGTLGYKILFPEVEFLKLLYMTGITLTTVGYGDVLGVEKSSAATIYTLILMIGGMGVVLYSTSLLTAYIVEGNLRNAFTLVRLRKKVKNMKDHYIICGAGETGSHVIREMAEKNKTCIVIELNEQIIEELKSEFPEVPILHGDATSDILLEEAGIEQAKGLVASLSNDKDNLYLTLSAKLLKPELKIVAKAIELTMIKKLKKAGAHRVVSPNYIGGMRMASEILRPHVTTLLDQMLRGDDQSLRIEETTVKSGSHLVGKTLQEVNFLGSCGVNVLAIGDLDMNFLYNPKSDTILKENDILVYIGNAKQKEQMGNMVKK